MIVQLAGLVANMDEEQQALFYFHAGFPKHKVREQVMEMWGRMGMRKVATFYGIPMGEDPCPTDEAVTEFNRLHMELVYGGVGGMDLEEPCGADSDDREMIEMWGDIDPWDPVLVEVVEKVGADKMLLEGGYSTMEVPPNVELETCSIDYTVQYEVFWMRHVREACSVWLPNF